MRKAVCNGTVEVYALTEPLRPIYSNREGECGPLSRETFPI